MRAARDVKVTLGIGIALLIAVGAVTLTRAPPRLVRVGTRASTLGGTFINSAEVCQGNEVLPADVTAIRLGVGAYFGSRIGLRVFSGSHLVTQGDLGPVWTGTSATVPVTPVGQAVAHVKLCIAVGPNSELIFLRGVPASARETAVYATGEPLGGRVGVEYLGSGRGSWWSRILSVARHMGIGHALEGTWVVLLIAALVAAVGVLAVGLTLRELP